MNYRDDLTSDPEHPLRSRRVPALLILEVEPGKFLQLQLSCHEATLNMDEGREDDILSFGAAAPIRTTYRNRTYRVELEGVPLQETYVDRPAWAEEPQGEIEARRALPAPPLRDRPPGTSPHEILTLTTKPSPGRWHPEGEGWPPHLRPDAPRQQCDECGRFTVAPSEFGQPCRMPQPLGALCPGEFIPYEGTP